MGFGLCGDLLGVPAVMITPQVRTLLGPLAGEDHTSNMPYKQNLSVEFIEIKGMGEER